MIDHSKDETIEAINRRAILTASDELTTTDRRVRDIVNETGIPFPDFYTGFRKEFGCTPTEYREKSKANVWRHVKSETESQPFDFVIGVKPVGPPAYPTHPSGASIKFNSTSRTEIYIPIVINNSYGFEMTITVISGKFPANGGFEFMSSHYRDQVNAMVVEALSPFFYGDLNIAYFQSIGTPNGSGFKSGPNQYPRWPLSNPNL